MADEFKQNEDVLHLAKFLILGIVVMVLLATIFLILDVILAPNSKVIDTTINNIWGSLYALCFFIAFLTAIYGLFYQMAKDDSNIIRVISLVYGLAILSVLLVVLFPLLSPGSAFTNPIPFSI